MFCIDEYAFAVDQAANDWTTEIAGYLRNPTQKVSRKLRYKAIKFVLFDNQLYYKSIDGVLLKCLDQEEAKIMRIINGRFLKRYYPSVEVGS